MMTSLPDASVILSVLNAHEREDECAHEREHGQQRDAVVVHAFEQLDSTSGWLHDHAACLAGAGMDFTEGGTVHVCVTDWQRAGVGRRGRQWQTQPGNITVSILASTRRPVAELMGLSLVTGIAVVDCLGDMLDIKARLKWPNDVLLNDRKLGGLLTELNRVKALPDNAGLTQIITGIGVNLRHDAEVLGLGIGATSLEQAGILSTSGQRDRLVGGLVSAVLMEHACFMQSGWAAYIERWSGMDWLAGRDVLIHRDDSTEQAIARGVNDQGALLVERAGVVHPLYSGNVSIRPIV